jgi:hypothetical protein
MGCDYYIYTGLVIKYTHRDTEEEEFIELSKARGYYELDDYDSDDEDYDELVKDYIEKVLTSTKKPIDIYKNNQFVNEKMKNKYYNIIDAHINNIYNFSRIKFENIIEITKEEWREERE